MGDSGVITVREMGFDAILPNPTTYMEDGAYGYKVAVIGKPGTGKSTFMSALMKSKKDIIPSAVVQNGTESSNHFYGKYIPDLFIYDEFDEDILHKVIKRQEEAIKDMQNPWLMLVLDDVTEDAKVLNLPVVQDLFKKGRHYKLLLLLSLQYAMDIRPGIRTCIDIAVIFRETREDMRKKLFTNFSSVIGTYSVFTDVMDAITGDHTALVINNMVDSNNPSDCVFYMKVDDLDDDFKFGSRIFHKYGERFGRSGEPP